VVFHGVQIRPGTYPAHIQLVTRIPCPEVKRLDCETDHSASSAAEIKDVGICTIPILPKSLSPGAVGGGG
jgi:hypothetical protein